MSAAKVLKFEELQRTTGYTRRADVERALRGRNQDLPRRKGHWTTFDLVNQAGRLRAIEQDKYDAEIV
jgi:hypothetical protein